MTSPLHEPAKRNWLIRARVASFGNYYVNFLVTQNGVCFHHANTNDPYIIEEALEAARRYLS